ncbi:3' terminal RNA ribose 2'-O-methyltransferase Hen1 [Chitinophaga skermanii]|uniref:Small RNA 2'-O-methyltransferase n=1 Tax=Chitinophaga skermanii TaxID=331697 RepID=A0A327QWL4_9BACT|nr:3' terminal RNA ribose 2'-O-methyltransferase Hen1 [Chitinophaga skermanii]RAJ08721.1 3' terminal RNA ribose 2'-O-methyltransferase Hen1 [Chitinophaga skermanii]
MLLSITNTRKPATDLGFLLHKHPAKLQSVNIKSGIAHIFYSAATEEVCTCNLLLDIDPVSLVRDHKGGGSFALEQYVNDRPYVVSSLMSTAITKAFTSAVNGKCKDKPELVAMPMDLTVALSVVPIRGGVELLQNLFEPLGYTVKATQYKLDENFPEWGDSHYYTVELQHHITVQQLLSHLYVLIPVMDNVKHYFVNEDEVEKLLAKGEGWLEQHPFQELIVKRYLRYRSTLLKEANSALDVKEEEALVNEESGKKDACQPNLHDQRLATVRDALLATEASAVLDLGCGEGKLLRLLLEKRQFTRILGIDISLHVLNYAKRRLKFNRLSEEELGRITLAQGSVLYKDERLLGYDAAALVEVIEHLEEHRLQALEKNLFGYLQTPHIFITTPNKDWNNTFTEDNSKMRHTDHRFEWTRAAFAAWCEKVATTYPYKFVISDLGDAHEVYGAPSQLVHFTKI